MRRSLVLLLAAPNDPRVVLARQVLARHSDIEVSVVSLGGASGNPLGAFASTPARLVRLLQECLARGPKVLICLSADATWAPDLVAHLCGIPICLSAATPAELDALPQRLEHASRQCGVPLAVKRALDIALAGSALLALSPVAVATALAIGLKLGRPVLFRQTRPGKHGQPFAVCKFRTMSDARAPDGSLLPDAQRLGRFGRFLRAASLDELPQLLNVLRGEMSLIGPRPLMPQYLERYSQEQARRHDVLPGISGLAQVSGRNATSWSERLQLDVDYVDNWSLALDLSILLRTLGTVLGRKGISQPGHATMPEFMGNTS